METDDNSELEMNDELRGMISGNFENTPDVEKGQETRELPRLVNLDEDQRSVDEMYSKIKEDPTKKIPRLYQEVRAKATENLDFGERCALLDEWPTYRAVQSRLYTVPWTASRSRSETSTSWPNV